MAPLSQNARVALVGVLGAAAAFFVFRGGGGSAPSDPTAAVPKDSFLVATVDAVELRRSPLYDAVLGKDAPAAASALGIRALADACGFDPLSRVTKLAVAVPEEGERGEIGLAAKVEVTRDELEKCTKALAEKRGGTAETREVGSFAVLEAGEGGASRPRIAYGRGGLLLVGRGAWLDAMIAAAEKKAPGLDVAETHQRLRASLTSREGWRAPTLLATAILPRALRDRLKREMGAEVGEGATNNMGGVLGVSAVGVALKTGGAGGLVEATVELECDSSEACGVVDQLIQKKRLEWSRDLALRMVGFGPLVDSLETKHDGAHLRATASAGADALAGAIERATKLRARREQRSLLPRPSAPDAPRPDERITSGETDAGRPAEGGRPESRPGAPHPRDPRSAAPEPSGSAPGPRLR